MLEKGILYSSFYPCWLWMMCQGFFSSSDSLNLISYTKTLQNSYSIAVASYVSKEMNLERDVDIGQCRVYDDCNVGMLYDLIYPYFR